MGGKFFIFLFLIFSWNGLFAIDSSEETAFKIAVRAFNQNAYSFCVNKLESILQNPDSEYRARALFYAGLSYFHLEDFTRTETYFADLARDFPLAPETGKSRYFQCMVLYKQKKYTAAIDEGRQAIRKYPQGQYNGRIQILLGDIYLTLGQDEEALAQYRRVKGDYKEDAGFKEALYYFNQGEFDTAERTLNTLIRTLRDDTSLEKIRYYKTKAVFFSKDYERAAFEIKSFLMVFGEGEYADEIRFYAGYLPFELKDYQLALTNLEAYLEDFPKSALRPDAHYYLGRSFENLSQSILALSEYGKITNLFPNSDYKSPALRRMYTIFSDSKQEKNVLDLLESLKNSTDPEDREFAVKELAFYFLEKDLDKSEGYFNQLLKEFGEGRKSFKYYRWYSLVLLKKNQTEKAIDILEQAYERFPAAEEKLDVLRLLADNLVKVKNYSKAREYYSRIRKDFDGSPEKDYGTEGIAYTFYLEKQYTRSLEYYSQLKRSSILFLRATGFFYSGEVARLLKNYPRALTDFDAFVKNFPKDRRAKEAGIKIGKIYYDKKDYSAAYDAYETVFNITQHTRTRSRALYYMGWSLYHNEETDLAHSNFSRLKEIDPEFTSPYTGDGLLVSGKILYNQEKFSQAVDVYITIINKGSYIKEKRILMEAYYELSICLVRIKNIRQAEFYAKKLEERFPKEKKMIRNAWMGIADAQVVAGEFAQAAAIYKKLANSAPTRKEKAEALYYAAKTWESMNKGGAAKGLYQEIVSLGTTDYFWDAKYALGKILLAEGSKKEAFAYFNEVSKASGRADLGKLAGQKLKDEAVHNERAKVRDTKDLALLKAMLPTLKDKTAKGECHYRIARILSKQKKGNEAVVHFKKTTDLLFSSKAAMAQWEITKYYFKRNDFITAYNEGQNLRFLYMEYQGIVGREDVLYAVGVSALKTGNKNEAADLRSKLVNKYPGSKYLAKFPPVK